MSTTLSDDERRDLIHDVAEIAEEAGEATLEYYEEAEAQYKDDESPLTEADLEANRIIEEGLGELDPDFPVISEESEIPDYEERRDWDPFWVVDPLDGTKEFLKQNDEFTVNIGLVDEGRPTLGVVRAPALDLTYFAAAGTGAFKRVGDGDVEMLEAATEVPETVTVVVSRSHIRDATEAFVDRLREDYEVELFPKGSSLKMCMVAEDSAQIYPRLGPTMEWDTAAAHAVVDHAGAAIERPDGETLAYNKEDLLNPNYVVYSVKDLVPENWSQLSD